MYKDGGLVLGDDSPDGGGEGGEEEEVEEDQSGHLGLEDQQDVLGVRDMGSHLGFWVGGERKWSVDVVLLSHCIIEEFSMLRIEQLTGSITL